MPFENYGLTETNVVNILKSDVVEQVLTFITTNNFHIPLQIKNDFDDLVAILSKTSQLLEANNSSATEVPAPNRSIDNQIPSSHEATESTDITQYYLWKFIRVLKAVLDENADSTNNLRTALTGQWDRTQADTLLSLVDSYEDNQEAIDTAIHEYEAATAAEREAVGKANAREVRAAEGWFNKEDLEEIYQSDGRSALEQMQAEYKNELEKEINSFFDLVKQKVNPEAIAGLENLRNLCLLDRLETPFGPQGIMANILDLPELGSDSELLSILKEIDTVLHRNYIEIKKFLAGKSEDVDLKD